MTMVRNAIWKVVRHLAFRRYDLAAEALSEAHESNEWSPERLAEALAPYWAEYDSIDIGPDARSAGQLQSERDEREWRLVQILLDPNADRSWHMRFDLDLEASREAVRPVLTLRSLGD